MRIPILALLSFIALTGTGLHWIGTRSLAKSPAPAAVAIDDTVVANSVRTLLRNDEQLKTTMLFVKSLDGHIMLEGLAPDAEALARAKLLALSVPGVRSVQMLAHDRQM